MIRIVLIIVVILFPFNCDLMQALFFAIANADFDTLATCSKGAMLAHFSAIPLLFVMTQRSTIEACLFFFIVF